MRVTIICDAQRRTSAQSMIGIAHDGTLASHSEVQIDSRYRTLEHFAIEELETKVFSPNRTDEYHAWIEQFEASQPQGAWLLLCFALPANKKLLSNRFRASDRVRFYSANNELRDILSEVAQTNRWRVTDQIRFER